LSLIVDKEGRGLLMGAWLRARAFPLRQDIRSNQLMKYMRVFEKRGMINLYSVDGRDYFEICNWHKYQSTTKEAESNYPPNPDLFQTNSVTDIDKDVELNKDKDVDEDVSDNDLEYLEDLSETFTKWTHKAHEPKEFLPLLRIGATKHDFVQAFRELAGKDLNIPTTPKGLWNPVVNVINKRKAKKEQIEPDYRKYLKGEYGNVGIR